MNRLILIPLSGRPAATLRIDYCSGRFIQKRTWSMCKRGVIEWRAVLPFRVLSSLPDPLVRQLAQHPDGGIPMVACKPRFT